MGISSESFFTPEKVSYDDLLKVHSEKYLNTLNYSSTLAQITEISLLGWLPNFVLQSYLLDPMRYATEGTIMATKLALERGWSINLSGGYHHAKKDNGEGFCVYADIPLACMKILEEHPEYKILIVDLDAHQGNGVEMLCGSDERIFIMDFYNSKVYPQDFKAQKYIHFDYPFNRFVEDEEYLWTLKKALPKAINEVKPNLIIYNAGSDIYENDPLGQMSISKKGIIERDAFLFTTAKDNNIPITMLLAGGYTQKSAMIISRSIENILKNIAKVLD